METVKFTHRYIARLVIEAKTSLAVGSGNRDVMTDQLIVRDINGLPYIPGTTLSGVLRHAIRDIGTTNALFGFQEGDDGAGSRLIISSAQMIGKNGIVIDGFQKIDFTDSFYAGFNSLPVRQHVRLSHKGAAEKHGKFDEEVVYKGTRFCFEMEMISDDSEEDKALWNKIILEISNPTFRIGGGTRKGFGEIEILTKQSKSAIFNLEVAEDLKHYLDKTSSLNDEFWEKKGEAINPPVNTKPDWLEFDLKLKPQDYFLFSSGFASEDGSADMSFTTEQIIEWDEGTGIPSFSEQKVLIPASSVKGAIAHRTAFHFNKSYGIFADQLEQEDTYNQLKKNGYNVPDSYQAYKDTEDKVSIVTAENPAIKSLFGYSANDDDQRGRGIFYDVFISNENVQQKLLNHVAIDRFTGGAIAGKLFSEQVVSSDESVSLKIFIENKDVKSGYLEAFKAALNDVCNGMLLLGGGTMRGHGTFTGTLTVDGKGNNNE